MMYKKGNVVTPCPVKADKFIPSQLTIGEMYLVVDTNSNYYGEEAIRLTNKRGNVAWYFSSRFLPATPLTIEEIIG
jgi:hypothetical protein